jgi:glycine/D-amino acid oxidase-like deaminating enzyme
MAIDTPAKIAILGAGPIGLEAALYARFLGYEAVVFEAGEIAASVRRWGHVRMFTPFGMNRSPLGLAAIQAQDEQYQPPGDEELLTGNEWIDRYLLPLSCTDLLADHLRLDTTVVGIGKRSC